MASIDGRFSGVSSDAVAAATGRDWDQWVAFLDELGAAGKTHKEIVALAAGPGGVASGWWQQSVAVGYEQARGLRVVGQTSDADFQIGVQKTLPIPAGAAWELLTGDPGRESWLGPVGGWTSARERRTERWTAGRERSVPARRASGCG